MCVCVCVCVYACVRERGGLQRCRFAWQVGFLRPATTWCHYQHFREICNLSSCKGRILLVPTMKVYWREWSDFYPNLFTTEEGSLIVHWTGAKWVPDPVWIVWSREKYLAFARNKSWFLNHPVCSVVGNYCAVTCVACYNQAVSLPLIISAATWTHCLKPEYGSSMFIWNIIARLKGAAFWMYTVNHGCTAFSKIQKPSQNPGHQKDDIKHILYWVPHMLGTNIKEFVVTTETWHPGFLHPCCKTAFNYEVRKQTVSSEILWKRLYFCISLQQLGKEAVLTLYRQSTDYYI